MNDINEKKLHKHGNVKVFYFSGARINDMNHHLIIAKQFNFLILQLLIIFKYLIIFQLFDSSHRN